jgi:hypothetical protein
MTAVAIAPRLRPRTAFRVLVTYLVALAIFVGTALGIRAVGSTTAGSPTPRPQTGPPVTLVLPSTGDVARGEPGR